MKIETLTIKNLNSLSGESKICFDKEPFNGSGLFAITGPTGAGKSTIFDALCLALYGRTPRLKNPDDIMSRHSSDCYSELTFSVNSQKYRSRWEQRRSRGKSNGKLQGAKMYLVDLNGNKEKTIEDKKSAVPASVSRITGLDYDQFTRSILLAQGNFASFLKAGVNERADLLEKMTGSDIYSRLSIEAFDRAKKEDEKLERLKEKLGNTEILSIDTINELKNDLDHNESKRAEYREKIENLLSCQKWLEQEIILKHKIDSTKYDLQESIRKETEGEPLKNALRKLNRINDNLPIYENYIILKNDKMKKSEDRTRLLEEITQTESDVQKQASGVETLKYKRIKNLEYASAQGQIIKEAEVLKERISLEKEKLLKIEIQNNNQLLNKSEIENEISTDKRDLISLEKKKEAIDGYLKKRESYSKINQILPLVKDKLNYLSILSKKKNTIADHSDYSSIPVHEYDKITDELKNNKKKIITLENNIYTLNDSRPTGKEQFEHIKEILLNLSPLSKLYRDITQQNKNYSQDKKSFRNTISSLEDNFKKMKKLYVEKEENYKKKSFHNQASVIQAHLKEGDLCPVCNGIYHSSLVSNQDSLILSDLDSELEKISDEIQKLDKDIMIYHEKEKTADKNISDNQAKLNDILMQWNTIKGDDFTDLNPEQSDKANAIYKENDQDLSQCLDWEKEYNRLINEERTLKNSYEKLRTIHETIKEKEEIRREEKETELFIDKQLSPLNLQFSKNQLIDTLESYNFAYNRKIEEKTLIIDEINDKQKRLISSESNLVLINKRIFEINEEIQQYRFSIKQNTSAFDRLTGSRPIELIESEIKNKTEKSEKELTNAQDFLITLKEKLSQSKGRLDTLETELPVLLKQWQKVEKQFNLLLKTENLELKDFCQTDNKEKSEKLKEEIEHLRDHRIRAEESHMSSVSQLKELQKNKLGDQTLTDVSEQLKNLKNEIESLSTSIGVIKEKLEADNIKRDKLKGISELIDKQESSCLKWSKIRNLIGSADGKLYRKFVQGLTLEKLIELANIHLLRLNNRYRIERSDKKELEIEIVDCWQADTVRPSATLSGGESFLVSLALSLGLSELVGNKVVIDSLFLDEGFGTLDPVTLETVLSALETLQSGGKLIGIISHVEAIRERIAVQIRVKKLAGGRSEIEIV